MAFIEPLNELNACAPPTRFPPFFFENLNAPSSPLDSFCLKGMPVGENMIAMYYISVSGFSSSVRSDINLSETTDRCAPVNCLASLVM